MQNAKVQGNTIIAIISAVIAYIQSEQPIPTSSYGRPQSKAEEKQQEAKRLR
jgi:hypothetical protein